MTSRIHWSPQRIRRYDIGYFRRKAWMDRVVAAPIALLLTPIIAGLWVLVRLTSRGPGFYTQVRLGCRGKPFRIIKLRTMRLDAERGVGAVWSSKNDPRVTRIGRFLRKCHLDELPQVFNVLRGEMCFVGPRPERPEIAEKLSELIPDYFDRLVVPPGVTGMAQLHLPADQSVECVYKKLGFDFTYLERASLLLDFRVCLATACKLVPGMGDWLCQTVSGSPSFIESAYRLGEAIQRDSVKPPARTPRPQPLTADR